MRVQHNIMALNANRNLNGNNNQVSKSLEKLSSGYRINRAGDDAAGLAISEKMRAQISCLTQAETNCNDGISLIQTAEGALTEVHDMLNRMVELAEQSANGTYEDSVDRANLQDEISQLKSEIDRIADSTNFNGINLLNGDQAIKISDAGDTGAVFTVKNGELLEKTDGLGIKIAGGAVEADGSAVAGITATVATNDNGTKTVTYVISSSVTDKDLIAKYKDLSITVNEANVAATASGALSIGEANKLQLQIGESSDDFNILNVQINDMHAKALGIDQIDIGDQDGAQKAVATIKTAINSVSSQRGTLGALQNRLEHTVNNLSVTNENITNAESRIRDTDMAKEMMTYTSKNILTQAAQSMLAQANQQPQQVLSLLQ